MFGYVRPSQERLGEAEKELFSAAYCGLCHTLQRRYGLAARMILNYDLTFLAILLSGPEEANYKCCHCIAHPIAKRPCGRPNQALDKAADMSVILSWWQIQDGISDHGLLGGFKYRLAAFFLRRAYHKASLAEPMFDTTTQKHLQELATLEREKCPSIDRPADTFACLLAGAAEVIEDPARRRVLEHILYHLGRWVYLVDAADDLKSDLRNGNYTPLALRFKHENGVLSQESRSELANTMDRSIEQMAVAFELVDFGPWTTIIRSVVYEGLYAVGNSVLSGTFHRQGRKERNLTRKAGA